ncbi:hypothetical protein ACO0M4_33675 [Streptomyces sp. RGM 3693]|uniref:hypothetical protein n=1 Tax=Streptomyces sp. RGM 3693 TaxID=3413284 RepID=UPI003D2C966C
MTSGPRSDRGIRRSKSSADAGAGRTTSKAVACAVFLDREQVASLGRLLREIEQFFDACDDTVGDAADAHFGIAPSAESISAALSLHVDALDAALGTHETAALS